MRHSSSLSPVENLRRRDSSIDRDIESLRLEMAAIQRQCQRLVKHRHHLQLESDGPPAAGRDEDSALVQPGEFI
jgi:chromosome segregation ATPase